jgi:hypothetical protein
MARTTYTAPRIDEYLRNRLMPVEGAFPNLSDIRQFYPRRNGRRRLFEHINFQQRYDIDARIRHALKRSNDFLQPLPAGAMPRNSVDDQVEWLSLRLGYNPEIESEYRTAERGATARSRKSARALYHRGRFARRRSRTRHHFRENRIHGAR